MKSFLKCRNVFFHVFFFPPSFPQNCYCSACRFMQSFLFNGVHSLETIQDRLGSLLLRVPMQQKPNTRKQVANPGRGPRPAKDGLLSRAISRHRRADLFREARFQSCRKLKIEAGPGIWTRAHGVTAASPRWDSFTPRVPWAPSPMGSRAGCILGLPKGRYDAPLWASLHSPDLADFRSR